MTDDEQVLLTHQYEALARECARLRVRLCEMCREYKELEKANRELRVENRASDDLIAWMKKLLGWSRS